MFFLTFIPRVLLMTVSYVKTKTRACVKSADTVKREEKDMKKEYEKEIKKWR